MTAAEKPVTTRSAEHTARRSIVVTAAIAAVWLVVSVVRTETTLHLGPLLVPLVPSLLAWGAPGLGRATLAASGFGAGVLTFLAASGNLAGPALAPFPDALSEGVVFLAASSVAGLSASRLGGRQTP